MGLYNWISQMPFVDEHQLNLDFILSKYKKLEDDEAEIRATLEEAEAARDDAEASAEAANEYKNDVLEWLETPSNMRPFINETVRAYIELNGLGLDINDPGLLTIT